MKTGMRITLLCCLLWLGTTASGWTFYNPTTGRWLTRDSIGEADTRNLYCFVRNQPGDLVDKFGKDIFGGPLGWPLPPNNPIDTIVDALCPNWLCCCEGKRYNPITHCCCAGKVLQRVKYRTGFKICTAPAHSFDFVPHTWIEFEGRSADVVASGSIISSPALLSVPSSYQNNPDKKCDEWELENCKYDFGAFQKAARQILDNLQSLVDPRTHTATLSWWTYVAGYHDCRHFANAILFGSLDAAKRNCKKK
jgi:hypothetical protein